MRTLAAAASACVIASLLIIVAAATAASASSSSVQRCTVYRGVCQADWMSRLPAAVRSRPFKQLVVVGSHDSGAHRLRFNMTPPCQATPLFNVVLDLVENPLAAPIITPIVDNLTITQPSTILQQLEQGVRSFDLRITWSRVDGRLWISHTYTAEHFAAVLAMFRDFMIAHPGEVVSVTAGYDWEHRAESAPHSQDVIDQIQKYVGPFLSRSCRDIGSLTIASMVATGQRMLFEFAESFPGGHPPPANMCASGMINTFWPNGQSANMSVRRLERYINRTNFAKHTDVLDLIFFTITPDTKSIIRDVINDIFSRNHTFVGLRQYAREMAPYTRRIMDGFVASRRSGINIVSVDWPTDAQIQRAIEWNMLSPV